MGAALVLEHAVGARPLDLERVVAVGDRQRFDREAAALPVAGQHPVQVAGEQPGLVATGAGADLDDDVLVVSGVRLDHREPDLLLELGESHLRRAQHLAELGVVAVLGEQLAGTGGVVGRAPVLLRELVCWLQVAVSAAHVRVAGTVADDVRIGHLLRQFAEARLDLLDQLVDHRAESSAPRGMKVDAIGSRRPNAAAPAEAA